MDEVKLFVVPGMQDNAKAVEVLKRIPGVQIKQMQVPASVQEGFNCPFVREDDGTAYFGLSNIESYVRRIEKGSNGNGTNGVK